MGDNLSALRNGDADGSLVSSTSGKLRTRSCYITNSSCFSQFFLVLTLSATSFMAWRQAFGRIVETDACRQALGVFRVPSGLSSRRFFLFLSDTRVKSVIFNQI